MPIEQINLLRLVPFVAILLLGWTGDAEIVRRVALHPDFAIHAVSPSS
jgi:hypothetical protein